MSIINNFYPSVYSNTFSASYSNAFDAKTYSNDIKDTIEELVKRINQLQKEPPLLKNTKCPNCGGVTELQVENHILKCPYCKSVILIGVKQINSK